ncbi:MAG: RNA-binding transcriptional accessory protein [Desulfobacteraceae bacterium]|nr:RNA-binding transcriptional accessory protein [Desulfobacteraceae bacterium]
MSDDPFITEIAGEQNIPESRVKAAADLLEQGASIPFIARYRKEVTGSLDEVAVTAIRDRLHQLKELSARKETVLNSLEKNGHLTDELRDRVTAAETLSEVEDIYLPYRPKRRTRGVKAREKGLEPLAEAIFAQTGIDCAASAQTYVDPEKGVESADEALAGARDIIAEMISENQDARARLRDLFLNQAVIKSSVVPGMEEKGAKFRDYFEWEEPITSVPSHRMLAIRRGETEDVLTLRILPDESKAIGILEQMFVTGDSQDSQQVRRAVSDAYKRLLSSAMETEARLETKKLADAEAIAVFTENLRQVLLSPPLGARRVLGIDPGYRTGCKVVCLNRQGKLLYHDTIYPHTGKQGAENAAEQVKSLCKDYGIEAVAVGNGTAGRETEAFVRRIDFGRPISVIMVNESGASVYSASDTARREFPDLDLTVRGAVSIGRRLMDPLAELVKIDPKSIGVGQYQHDVDQRALKHALDDVVTSCVNAVGVDANRASAELLTYVSGLNSGIAKNIVAYRDENGPFAGRNELKKVPRLGPRAFEQSAGFLRIAAGKNPLDASAVHPESYHIVDAMARDLGASVKDLIRDPDLRGKIYITRYITDTVGVPTLEDIMAELAKPGRDIREKFEEFSFAEGVEKIEDLAEGMRLPGIVTNITAFGAFVDVGVHQDGLVHISEMADRFVKNPADVVSVQQKVRVTVLSVDMERRRISLSLKESANRPDR